MATLFPPLYIRVGVWYVHLKLETAFFRFSLGTYRRERSVMSEKAFQVGDVIESEKFAYGYRDSEGSANIFADGQTTHHIVWRIPRDGQHRGVLTAETNYAWQEYEAVDLGAYDLKRASARFVVEESRPATVPGPQDERVFEFFVRARRLDGSGKYDPRGECIQFFTTGTLCMIDPADIRVVVKMRKIEVFVTDE